MSDTDVTDSGYTSTEMESTYEAYSMDGSSEYSSDVASEEESSSTACVVQRRTKGGRGRGTKGRGRGTKGRGRGTKGRGRGRREALSYSEEAVPNPIKFEFVPMQSDDRWALELPFRRSREIRMIGFTRDEWQSVGDIPASWPQLRGQEGYIRFSQLVQQFVEEMNQEFAGRFFFNVDRRVNQGIQGRGQTRVWIGHTLEIFHDHPNSRLPQRLVLFADITAGRVDGMLGGPVHVNFPITDHAPPLWGITDNEWWAAMRMMNMELDEPLTPPQFSRAGLMCCPLCAIASIKSQVQENKALGSAVQGAARSNLPSHIKVQATAQPVVNGMFMWYWVYLTITLERHGRKKSGGIWKGRRRRKGGNPYA